MRIRACFLLLFFVFASQNGFSWGFYAHKRINRLAVFTLPPEMIGFFKYYITYISENAVNPDKRRYAVEGEAPRHYIDVDIYDPLYGDSAVYKIPRYWEDAVARHTEDTLQAYGIIPWHIQVMKMRLTRAFRSQDVALILRLAADIGHYIGDSNVPLHTTVNYNGQLTNQIGIHGFWESRIPELFSEEYDFFVGPAEYEENTQLRAWAAVIKAHEALDSVLTFERELSKRFPGDKKYTVEERNGINIRTYSRPFCTAFHRMLDGQVERRMRASIKMVGDFWYTCWIDAGQPDLKKLISDENAEKLKKEKEETQKKLNSKKVKSRPHEQVACGHRTHRPRNSSHKSGTIFFGEALIRSCPD
ncbi:MAG: zinc dependent phospholipase C family protein [Bacteroidota bacterium]